MRVPLFTLAEYASVDSTGKLLIAGVAEGVSLQRKQGVPADVVGPVQIPPLFLVAIVEGSIVDGTTHSVGIQVVNDDRKDVAPASQLGVFQDQQARPSDAGSGSRQTAGSNGPSSRRLRAPPTCGRKGGSYHSPLRDGRYS